VSQVLVVLLSAALGAVGGAVGVGWRPRTWKRMTSNDVKPLTRLDAHQASATPAKAERPSSATSAGLRRDAQKVMEATEAQDLEVLDRLLRDIRDLTSADEVIFWRWIEARQTLVPNAWSTEGEPRPRFFDMTGWGPSCDGAPRKGRSNSAAMSRERR